MTRFAIIEAPSVLGLFPAGVQDLPTALLRAGLAQALGARHAGHVEAPPWRPERDPVTGSRNAAAIAAYAAALADVIGPVLEAGEFPTGTTGPRRRQLRPRRAPASDTATNAPCSRTPGRNGTPPRSR
jgi:hypothetical protein